MVQVIRGAVGLPLYELEKLYLSNKKADSVRRALAASTYSAYALTSNNEFIGIISALITDVEVVINHFEVVTPYWETLLPKSLIDDLFSVIDRNTHSVICLGSEKSHDFLIKNGFMLNVNKLGAYSLL